MKFPNHGFVISLNERKDRRIHFKKQIRKFGKNKKKKGGMKLFNCSVSFHIVEPHLESPVIGCATSHKECLELAQKNKWDSILIMEDDVVFKAEIANLPEPPCDWDILYLGYNLNDFADDEKIDSNLNPHWKRLKSCYATHCYIVRSTIYEFIIQGTEENVCESTPYDVYLETQMSRLNCYGIYPVVATQMKDFSNIEQKNVEYSQLLDKKMIPECNFTFDSETNQSSLVLPPIPDDLPMVSIITPTKNRARFLPLTYMNIKRQTYPMDKLEWIILDDTEDETEIVEIIHYISSRDNRVRFVQMQTLPNYKQDLCTIAKKRNMGAKLARGSIIVHMDDDDIYEPEYIEIHVRFLINSNVVGCTGCTLIGCYHLMTNESFSIGSRILDTMAEASMAYKKEFWKERKWNELMTSGEGSMFLSGRQHRCLQIPYQYMMIAMNHKTNITGTQRSCSEFEKSKDNFYDNWPFMIQNYILKLREYQSGITNLN